MSFVCSCPMVEQDGCASGGVVGLSEQAAHLRESAPDHHDLVDTARALLDQGDERLGDDDLSDACRHFLVAAWCFARVACCPSLDQAARRDCVASYWYAWKAAQTLLSQEI